MSTLIEDYLREVEHSLRVDASRRRQIVDELRTHLAEKIRDETNARPDAPKDEIERDVLRDFGNPRDLALAYEPDGTAVLMRQGNDVALRLGKAAAAVGRGTGRFLKGVAITLGVLLVVALGVGAWAFTEIKPYIPSILQGEEYVYRYDEGCRDTPCSGTPPGDKFHVRDDARSVRFRIHVYAPHGHPDPMLNQGNGSVTLKVFDALGAQLLERTFTPGFGTADHHEASWAGIGGNWTVVYVYEGFRGFVETDAAVIGPALRND